MVVGFLVVGVCIREVVFWQLENDGDEDEEFACYFPDVAMEGGDLGIVFLDYFMQRLVG